MALAITLSHRTVYRLTRTAVGQPQEDQKGRVMRPFCSVD